MRSEVILLRKHIFDFINDSIFKQTIGTNVLEIGPMSSQYTPIKEYYVDTKSYFLSNGFKYFSCDIDTNSHCDYICSVLDLCKVKERFDNIICLDVLEHVDYIWEVPKILHSLLNNNGKLFLSVPYYFYQHSPFPDYWRLSEYAIRLLFDKYFDLEMNAIYSDNDVRKPIHYNIIGIKK